MKPSTRPAKKKSQQGSLLSIPAKKTVRQRRFFWIWCAGLLSCVLVGLGVHAALQGGLHDILLANQDFKIKEIQIHVNGTIPKAEVLQWSGIRAGQNLLAVDLDKVRNSMLCIPYVSDVRLEKKLPDTLKISVDERQPLALIHPRSKNKARLLQDIYYIDVQGIVMKPKPGERLRQLPVITGVDSDLVIEGMKLEHAGVLSALNFIRLVEISSVQQDLNLGQIDVRSEEFFTVKTRQGGTIRFRPDYLEEQLYRLDVIFEFAHTEGKIIQTVDLSPHRNVPVTF